MNSHNLTVGGAVCFWSLAKSTNRQVVADGLRRLELDDYVPDARTPMSCLRAALEEVYEPQSKEERYVIRPIKTGFAVVCELPDQAEAGGDWGTVVAKATMDEYQHVDLDPYNIVHLDRIKAGMAGAAEWLTTASVGKSLIGIVEHFGGVTLRPAGGVYWLNENLLDRWADVADLFERASAMKDKTGADAKPSKIHVLRVVADEQMVSAVGDALESEITSALTEIESELSSGELKPDACERRLHKTGKLLSKVKSYEHSFGMTLEALHQHLDRVSGLAAMATLQASAAVDNGQTRLAFCA